MRIHQVCARLQFGDAITNHVLRIHQEFIKWGMESHVYAHETDATCAPYNEGEQVYARNFSRRKEDLLLYHYSVFNPNHKLYLSSRNKKILIYHNITPPEFFEQFNPAVAEVCRKGLELLPRLKGCDLALGDSEFNRQDLVAAGFRDAASGVLPIFIDWPRYDGPYNRELWQRLADGRVNLFFVGRLAPNKRFEDLIRLFALYKQKVNAHSRLIIPGSTWSIDYNNLLVGMIRRFGLEDSVEMSNHVWGVPDADLLAYFRAASVFVSMSEHEGFCVPLVEAMRFDLPILAFDCTAIPYTLAGAGVLFKSKEYPILAETLESLAGDETLRTAMVERGRARLADFSEERLSHTLMDHIAPFLT